MSTRALWLLGGALVLASACNADPIGRFHATRFGDRSDIPVQHAPFDQALTRACRTLAPTPGRDLLRAPYVQRVSEQGGELLWTARSQTPHTLEIVREDGSRVGRYAAGIDPTRLLRGATQESVALSGLAPSTVYCYALRDARGNLQAARGLRTAPAPGSGARVSFVAFGDAGQGGIDQQAVFREIKDVPFDLVLITGDVAYPSGALDSYEHNFFEMYAPMLGSFPVFPVPGNHDYDTADGAAFHEVFDLPGRRHGDGSGLYYSFDWGDVHFVALDTERLDDAQAEWLEADLSNHARPWTIVFEHRSPYASGRHGSNLDVRELLSPIFERHQVPLVLAGHDHDYERTQVISGVTYVVTGGGGRGTQAVGSSPFTAFSHDVLHFVYVTIEGDDLRLYAIDATGQEFDFAHLKRAAA